MPLKASTPRLPILLAGTIIWNWRKASEEETEVRSTPRASAREDLRRNFCAAANFKYQRGYRSRNSGVRSCRSCRIGEQGLYPKIQDQHLPGKILAKLPDSLAPELLQLLTPEFRNVLGGQAKVSEK